MLRVPIAQSRNSAMKSINFLSIPEQLRKHNTIILFLTRTGRSISSEKIARGRSPPWADILLFVLCKYVWTCGHCGSSGSNHMSGARCVAQDWNTVAFRNSPMITAAFFRRSLQIERWSFTQCIVFISFHFILNSLYRVKLQKTDLQTALLIYRM